jgi:hypothetical protein
LGCLNGEIFQGREYDADERARVGSAFDVGEFRAYEFEQNLIEVVGGEFYALLL